MIEAVRQYLNDTLGVAPCIVAWDDARQLPYALRDNFDLYALQVLGREAVLAVRGADRAKLSPTDISTQLARITVAADRPVVYATAEMPAYERRRLVALRQPFIVPAAQMYLPDFGVDFRERVRGVRIETRETFAPATQAMLIQHLLIGSWFEDWSVADAAQGLHYTPMTASRVARELVAAGLFEGHTTGRHRALRPLREQRATWDLARPHLRSPVAHRLSLPPEHDPPMVAAPLAGLSALAALTLLTAPRWPIRALEATAARAIEGTRVDRTLSGGMVQDGPEYEVWRYTPGLLSDGHMVDPLSLLLSFDGVEDARVQGALLELEQTLPW